MRQLTIIIIVLCWPLAAQHRSVAITVDDLPYASGNGNKPTVGDDALAEKVNHRLLRAFRKHHIPVTGFVIEESVENLGLEFGLTVLKQWTVQGFDLGNHTYSHTDINQLSVPQIEDEILRGEISFVGLMKEVGKKPEFFRFPMNHTGDTKAKHDAVAAFLAQHGYQLATCTIDNSDYLFNTAYVRALEKKDEEFARKLRLEYVAYTSSEIDYYSALNKEVLGYEPPQVMLLHDNRLNADVIDSLVKLFEDKEYKFVSLRTAQSDPAYRIPDTYIAQYGPMWGYRWARERNVQVNGRSEPEPPQWVVDYRR